MTIILEPRGIRHVSNWDGVYWKVIEGAHSIEIEHSVQSLWSHLLPEQANGDHILLATLFYAMEKGCTLDVRGSLSKKLLDGVDHLQEIWSRWRPDRYKKITIQCQNEQHRHRAPDGECLPKDKGLFAFSGGVDATFTLMRHFYRDAGRQTVKPKAALLIQGFDIPYTATRDYAGAFRSAERILEECPGVDLIGLRTNSRDLGQDWEDSFGLQLGACFLALQKGFDYALKGSEEPYEDLFYPWGATPLTTDLCSSDQLKVIEDGCAFDRNQKVNYLAVKTKSSDHLRVCWAGDRMDRNCGHCEKCIRTMLNYWANGLLTPKSFPTLLSEGLVKSIVPRNEGQASNIRAVQSLAYNRKLSSTAIGRAVNYVMIRYKWRRFQNSFRSLTYRLRCNFMFFIREIINRK